MGKTRYNIIYLLCFTVMVACNSNNNESKEINPVIHKEHNAIDQDDLIDDASGSYQCPMKCEGDKRYADPGKCPLCKMQLKEVSNV